MIPYVIRHLLLVPILLTGVTTLIFMMLQFLNPIQRSALCVRDIPHNNRGVDELIIIDSLNRPLSVHSWKLYALVDPRVRLS